MLGRSGLISVILVALMGLGLYLIVAGIGDLGHELAPVVNLPNTAETISEASLSAQTLGLETSSLQLDEAVIKRVIDGDTVELESGERVRLIGVDTPESVKPAAPVECLAKEASAYTREYLEGKRVGLERDISDRDRFGRLLRYVWLGDVLFNQQLTLDGMARVVTYPPDVKYHGQLLDAQAQAQEREVGLWDQSVNCLNSDSI